jgi:menaquinone-dependent protoporphyrinogen oxidase
MARILIVFGTTDGQTEKVARAIADRLRSNGHETSVVDAAHGDPSPAGHDAIVVAASVHAGGYQRSIRRWVSTHSAALNRVPTAFVSVCLGVLQHDSKVDHELQTIVEDFFRSTSWRPLETKIVAGALKYTKYNIFERWIMKRIVTKAGGDTDTSKDYEYTDFDDLRQFADRLSNRLSAKATITKIA